MAKIGEYFENTFEFTLHEGNHVEAKTKFSFIGYAALDLVIANPAPMQVPILLKLSK